MWPISAVVVDLPLVPVIATRRTPLPSIARASSSQSLSRTQPAAFAQHGEPSVQGQALAFAFALLMCRVMAGISDAQPLHRREQVGHRQHGQHVVATSIDQAAQVFMLHHMRHHGE
jgi:hypothetical protein